MSDPLTRSFDDSFKGFWSFPDAEFNQDILRFQERY